MKHNLDLDNLLSDSTPSPKPNNHVTLSNTTKEEKPSQPNETIGTTTGLLNYSEEPRVYVLKNDQRIENELYVEVMEKLMELDPIDKIDYRWNDIGLGNLYADCFIHTARFCVDTQKWYVYENGRWKIDKGEILSQKLMQTLLQMLYFYADEIETEDNKNTINKYRAYINKCSSDTILRRALNVARTNMTIEVREFDSDPYLLHCLNGVFDGHTLSFRTTRPEDLFTRSTDSVYNEGKFFRPFNRWYSFIDEISSEDKEKARYLQKALGYSIMGENEKECMFLAYGKTRCGKGTLFNTVAKVLGLELGSEVGYGGAVPPAMICDTGTERDFNSPEPMLADTVGIRYLTMSETKQKIDLDVTVIKMFTGRDPVKTRQLHAPAFTFTPQFTLWLSTNYYPMVNDETLFLSNRIWVIPFNEHFEGDDIDEGLKKSFLLPENRPTILKWLIDGYKLYYQEGLIPPTSVVEATKAYARRNDRPLCFFEDCCEPCSNNKVSRFEMRKAYEQWCDDDERSYKKLGKNKFYEQMRRFLLEYDDGNGNRGYKDVRLKKYATNIHL